MVILTAVFSLCIFGLYGAIQMLLLILLLLLSCDNKQYQWHRSTANITGPGLLVRPGQHSKVIITNCTLLFPVKKVWRDSKWDWGASGYTKWISRWYNGAQSLFGLSPNYCWGLGPGAPYGSMLLNDIHIWCVQETLIDNLFEDVDDNLLWPSTQWRHLILNQIHHQLQAQHKIQIPITDSLPVPPYLTNTRRTMC